MSTIFFLYNCFFLFVLPPADWNLIPLNHSPATSHFLALHPSLPLATSSSSPFYPVVTLFLSPYSAHLLSALSFLFHHPLSRHPLQSRLYVFSPPSVSYWSTLTPSTVSSPEDHRSGTSTWTAQLSTTSLPDEGKMLRQPCFLPFLLHHLLHSHSIKWSLFIGMKLKQVKIFFFALTRRNVNVCITKYILWLKGQQYGTQLKYGDYSRSVCWVRVCICVCTGDC